MDKQRSEAVQRALALEIMGEVRRQGRTAKDVQQEAGILARSWTRYFTTVERDIPIPEAQKVADVLGVPLSYLFERAEREVAEGAARPKSLPSLEPQAHNPASREELSKAAEAAVDAQATKPGRRGKHADSKKDVGLRGVAGAEQDAAGDGASERAGRRRGRSA